MLILPIDSDEEESNKEQRVEKKRKKRKFVMKEDMEKEIIDELHYRMFNF